MDRALSSLRLKSIKSSKELPAIPKEYPADANLYELLEDCGRGVSATVHRAICKPYEETVAVKKLNLESMNCNLDEIIKETHTMKQYYHPNVLRLYTSFVTGHELWMVMPYISGGSVLHIMKYAFPQGLEEVGIATIMREVLKGLEYVHKQGGIHRDVKAGNILVDRDGSVKVGDFGVSATVDRGASWGNDHRARMTFVGTPCWMAPEVMEQTQGYDSSADIWSFGITLLELAHGHAPFAKFPPMKVLLMTLQNPPPTLDDKGNKHFSKHMRDVVTRCLQKDPKQRPSATELLQHKFFKQAKDEEYLVKHLLQNLPTLGERVNHIRTGKAATNAVDNDRELEKSNQEYVKGVSCWNFDVAALKAQAALEPDDSVPNTPLAPALPTIAEEGPDVTLGASSSADFKQAVAAAAADAFGTTLPPPAPINTSRKTPMPSAFAGATSTATSILGLGTPTCSSVTDLPLAANGPASDGGAPPQQQQQQQQPERGGSRGSLTHFYSEPVPNNAAAGASGATSPVNMSREGSLAAPSLATVSTGMTPTAGKQKTKGRFQVYERDEAPPFSPSAEKAAQRDSLQQDGLRPQQSERQSEDGVGHEQQQAQQQGQQLPSLATHSAPAHNHGQHQMGSAGAAVASGVHSTSLAHVMSVAPQQSVPMPGPPERQVSDTRPETSESSKTEKQKGRFKITEVYDEARGGMGKTPSTSNLLSTEMSTRLKSDVSHKALGSSSGGTATVGIVLPGLRELYEHSLAHTAALQRLMGQVEAADKGKPAPMLSRSVSKAGLFAESNRSASEHGSDHSVEALVKANAELRVRCHALEEENLRLRRHNTELVAAAGGTPLPASESNSVAASRRTSNANLLASAVPHSSNATPLASPHITPRQSQDEGGP